MSLLSGYEQQTAWKYEPIHGSFHTHEGLSQKVNPDGSYASFPGSTVVFRLENQCLQIIQLMQKVLYHKLGGDMLASILPASSLHMTLHDLISREMCISHTEESYRAKKAESLDSAAAITEEIQKDYEQCAEQGSTEEQVEESKRAMSRMTAILGHPDRLHRLAVDIADHYDALCTEKPGIIQKAMIVCADRPLAFQVLKEILSIRPDWGIARKAEDESTLSKEQLDKLIPLPKINLVATQGQNDEKELYDMCGTKEYRKKLDKQFKNDYSNFKIAIVVDMWITGFDVPSLAVMYIDKPLQKHTLIQTISRVNRVFEGKDKGLVVDYIGIKNDMLEAVKKYGGPQESPIDELNISLGIFRNHLALTDELLVNFDASKFYSGTPLERLNCLNAAAEYVQICRPGSWGCHAG